MNILDRFINYVKLDTQSAYNCASVPSTKKQLVLSKLLAQELKAMGVTDVTIPESGCVYATLPANCPSAPSIGFCAHVDTTPELSGTDVKARVVKNYDGKDIVLNEKLGIVMSPKNFPHLTHYIGQDLVVTDGTTLLGSDDKAGVAEIMDMVQYFCEHPKEKHGKIQLLFPTDEEVGCNGARTLDKSLFNPDFAYTLDGGSIGEITYETFNAATADVTVKGVNIHPGLAKNQMKNAILIAHDFLNMLPPAETPGHTEGYEGYYHVLEFQGEVELTKMRFYLRDHDKDKFAARKEKLYDVAAFLNKEYGEGSVSVEISDTYKNLKYQLEDHFEIVKMIELAMKEEGVEPFYIPMRGGTDGTMLSIMGIPCPNICMGGHNIHGRYEYVPVQSMEKIARVLIKIVKNFAQKA